MSAHPEADKKLRSRDASNLTVHAFLAKPIGDLRLLTELGAAATARPGRPFSFISGKEESTPVSVTLSSAGLLEDRVQKFQSTLDAEHAALFAIHPVSLITEIRAGSQPTDQRHNLEFWSHQLRFSPVRDVALDGQVFREDDADRRFAKNRWLHHAYGHRSCLGIPVKLPSEYAFCLFAFHSQESKFSPEKEALAEIFAREIAALLEKDRLLCILESDARRATSGVALNSLGHEIGNHVGAAALMVLRRIGEGAVAAEIKPTLVALSDRLNQAVEVSSELLEFARKEEIEPVSLRECVDRALRYSRPRADELDVQLVLDDQIKGNPMVEVETRTADETGHG
jgi:GAF domain